jgi:hypothetical protein
VRHEPSNGGCTPCGTALLAWSKRRVSYRDFEAWFIPPLLVQRQSHRIHSREVPEPPSSWSNPCAPRCRHISRQDEPIHPQVLPHHAAWSKPYPLRSSDLRGEGLPIPPHVRGPPEPPYNPYAEGPGTSRAWFHPYARGPGTSRAWFHPCAHLRFWGPWRSCGVSPAFSGGPVSDMHPETGGPTTFPG